MIRTMKNTGRKRAVIAVAAAILLLCPGLPAQQPPVQPAAPAAPAGPDLSKMRAPALNYKGWTIELVLNDYAEKTGRTLLIDPKAPKGGSITLKSQSELTMEEYLQATEAILAMNQVALIKVGEKFVKVVASGEARKEGIGLRGGEEPLKETEELVSQVIPLKYIDIKEAEAAVKNFIHSYGNLQLFERTNTILLTDTASNVARVMQVLGMIDQPVEKLEEPYVIQIQFAKASEIKTKLDQIIAESQEEAKKSTIPRQAPSGPPGVVAPPATPSVPGVIRPTKPAPPAPEASATTDIIEQAERGMVRGLVKIIADDRTNKLIIITRKENKRFFDEIIRVLDVETQPDVTVKILRLEYASAETVADTLNTLIGGKSAKTEAPPVGVATKPGEAPVVTALKDVVAQKTEAKTGEPEKSRLGELSAANLKILPDKRTNSILVMGRKQDLMAIEEIVKNMDMMLLQVMIEAVIVQIDLDDTVTSGIQWIQRALIVREKNAAGGVTPKGSFAASAGGGTPSVGMYSSTDNTVMSLGSWAGNKGLTTYFTFFGLNLDSIVTMLKTDNRNKVLSAPRIVTTDNTKAKLESTEQRYFLKGTTVLNDNTIRPETEMKDIGLSLEFTPHINKSRNVMMEIQQTISDVNATGQDIPTGAGQAVANWPTTKKRSFGASIAVRDRETIVLGGLVRKSAERQRTGVPFLGSIPIIGRLFRYDNDAEKQAEMVVFVTPYVLETPDEIGKTSDRHYEAIDAKELWDTDWSASRFAIPSQKEKERIKKEAREGEKNTGEAKPPETVPKEAKTPSTGIDTNMTQFMKEREAQWSRQMMEAEQSMEEGIGQ